MSHERPTRRVFVASLAGLALALVTRPAMAWGATAARRGPWPHPTPRPGIDGSRVLTRALLADTPDAVPVFDMVRQIPQIADGIRCHCGCAEQPGFRSLLSCFEQGGMAQECQICQGQARLAFELHGKGHALDEIRAAINARFG